MKFVLCVAVPALLLATAPSFAQDAAGQSNSSMSSNSSISAGSANSQLSASVDSSPTYQGGRRDYRGKTKRSLNRSEAQITAQLNQQQSSP